MCVCVFGQRNCENWLLSFMIYFIINMIFVIPLILGSYWMLLVRDVAMCSLFRLGKVYVANYIL
jgi:hypothetical protein